MRVEIFCVSFFMDAEFLRYLLLSIQKFAAGFAGVTIAVPFRDERLFRFVEELGAKLVLFDEAEGKGMMCHEREIVRADEYCPDADAILFVDSDAMFWEPVTPADYLHGDKPILLRERYATLTNKLRLNWKTAVREATGIDPEWETMLRMPIIHLPETLVKTRLLIQRHTGRDYGDYILSCRSEFPQTFCEHGTNGAVAIEHFPDRYHFIDYDVRTPDGGYDYAHGKDRMVAHWSHGGIERYRAQCEAILR